MKILWLCNVPIKKIAQELQINNCFGGWLDGAIEPLLKIEENEIKFLFPYSKIVAGQVDNLSYQSFKHINVEKEDKDLIDFFENFLRQYSPDIIHIWGTEYSHSLCMAKACAKINMLNKLVVNIQGLCSVIADKYNSHIPLKVLKRYTIKGILKGFKNINSEKKQFYRRGLNEVQTLKLAKNVIGRTDWDKACTTQINPQVNYYHCYETLRESFYKSKWDINECESHSIFVSQAGYPIKGFHQLLKAMPLVLKKFPDAKVYTTGRNLLSLSKKDKLKISSYEKYLLELIYKFNLENNISFLGLLDEQKMKEQYLKSHCFVSCSSIENASNSLGEAMLLGVPSISSFVGGITSIFRHGIDGFMYPFDEYNMLAYYICEIFSNDDLCLRLSNNSKSSAENIFDIKKNNLSLIKIYQKIIQNNFI